MSTDSTHRELIATRLLRSGWALLLLFLMLGMLLEALHGFKVGWYLDVSNSTRRHMWTLAHTHGTLLGIVQIVTALTLRSGVPRHPWQLENSSRCLIAAAVLMPGGFFLGGVQIYDGDPGLGVVLVPIGALLLVTGVALFVWSIFRDAETPRDDTS